MLFLNKSAEKKKDMSVKDSHTPKELHGTLPNTKMKLIWHLWEGTALSLLGFYALLFA